MFEKPIFKISTDILTGSGLQSSWKILTIFEGFKALFFASETSS